ncbi:TadE/TadG family type IV pilus assembly protein [Sphingomonas sp. CJ99]
MKRIIQFIRRPVFRRLALRRLGTDTGGLALLEFALSLPPLLLLLMAGAESTNYVIARMRISQLALHIADNAARIGTGSQLASKKITETDINDLFTGAQLQSGGLDLRANGRVILSSVEPVANPNSNARYKIAWQRCYGTRTTKTSTYGSAGDTNLVGVGPANRQVTATDYGATMFVEVHYVYRPLIRSQFVPRLEFSEIASMMVRDARDMTQIYNTENATVSGCAVPPPAPSGGDGDDDDDGNNGHGNDEDGNDESNPGGGGP